mmetsp:Transcript_3841/g.8142  ORF Transcript_3841/g.8142 Transcript_3841/m.8142 type:complete len:93 (-) Transcript_3841:1625-1903(-)
MDMIVIKSWNHVVMSAEIIKKIMSQSCSISVTLISVGHQLLYDAESKLNPPLGIQTSIKSYDDIIWLLFLLPRRASANNVSIASSDTAALTK